MPSNEERAVDLFGRLLMRSRDAAIEQWDGIIAGCRRYAPWDRLVSRFPDLTERDLELLRALVPNVVDTAYYWLLADLDASEAVRIVVTTTDGAVHDAATESWGLAAEPTGENGWLKRFSKERFEEPG